MPGNVYPAVLNMNDVFPEWPGPAVGLDASESGYSQIFQQAFQYDLSRYFPVCGFGNDQ